MRRPIKYSWALASVFIWIGFVGAISFMEAWLKFRAPGVTIPLGLGIGRIVFGALNKVEWLLAIIILLNLGIEKDVVFSRKNFLYFIAMSILIAQSFWLLPLLDARAEYLIQGQKLETSYVHFYYVGVEIIKVICLFIFGAKLFKTLKNV